MPPGQTFETLLGHCVFQHLANGGFLKTVNGLDVVEQKRQIKERNAISEKINQENKRKIMAAGTKVRTLTAKQRQAWVNVMKPVWSKFEKDIGADVIKAAVDSNAVPSN